MKFCSFYFSSFSLVKCSWIQVGFSPHQSRIQSLLTVLTTPLSAISEWGCCCYPSTIHATINMTVNVHITQQWGVFMQPLLQQKSNEYHTTCVCICSLRYPACNAHAPYFHLAYTALQNFATFSHKRHNCRKKKYGFLNTNRMFWLSNFCLKHFSF